MKRLKNVQKTLVIILTISMITVLFAGCGSSSTSTQTKSQRKTQTNGKSQGKGSVDPAAMKTRYETALKELVSNKTITQAQSDKVLAALTSNVPKKAQGGTQNSQEKNQNSNQGKEESKPKNNPLSSLVSSGVITQAQSDAIMQKIRGNQQNSQSTQN